MHPEPERGLIHFAGPVFDSLPQSRCDPLLTIELMECGSLALDKDV